MASICSSIFRFTDSILLRPIFPPASMDSAMIAGISFKTFCPASETTSVAPKRVIHVFNKADLIPDREAFLNLVRERYPHAVLTSTLRDGGVEDLRRALRTSAQALRPIAQIRVPVSNGRLLARLHRDAEIVTQVQQNGVVLVTARIEARLLGKLRQENVEVVLGRPSPAEE